VQETIVAPATPDALTVMHTALEHFWRTVDRVVQPPPGPMWRLAFTTAVAEIGANIVRHAYPPGGVAGAVSLRLRLYPGRVEARFIDNGVRYTMRQQTAVLPAIDADDGAVSDLAEGGYGLVIAQTVVDHLNYRRTRGGINCWRLVKRWAIHDTV
jgi:serine/threonine-protein kinase RsbW